MLPKLRGTYAGALIVALVALHWLAAGGQAAQDPPHADPAGQIATGESAGHDTHDTHAAGHHDETDLSHANASDQLTDMTELKSDLAIYTFLVFLLLVAVLSKFAWKPILAGLQKREQTIADMILDARRNAEKSQETLRQYEARIAAATDEARELVAQARKDAERSREQILAEAQAAATRERERAVADIQMARDQALRNIAEKSVDTAVTLARQIIRREVQPQEHSQLIREALDKFPSKN